MTVHRQSGLRDANRLDREEPVVERVAGSIAKDGGGLPRAVPGSLRAADPQLSCFTLLTAEVEPGPDRGMNAAPFRSPRLEPRRARDGTDKELPPGLGKPALPLKGAEIPEPRIAPVAALARELLAKAVAGVHG